MATAKLGTKDTLKCYTGQNLVNKAYLGTILVCDMDDQVGLLIRYTFSEVKTGRKI